MAGAAEAARAEEIPEAIAEYAKSLRRPVALIGCRAASINSRRSLDCCEYDVAVFFSSPPTFSSPSTDRNAVVRVGGHTVETLHLGAPAENMAALEGMVILGDSEVFSLSSSLQGITAEMRRKVLIASGRKSLASSLLCQQKMKVAAGGPGQASATASSAMWLKIGAYRFIQGTLALAGERPMPLHELAQARHAELAPEAAEGVEVALECIGVERSTRPAIARSIEAVAEIKSGDYDRELVMSKARHLLEKSMLADCYYYLGRVAADSLACRGSRYHEKYAKLVQISMDLASDSQRLEKLQKSLSRAARKSLLSG